MNYLTNKQITHFTTIRYPLYAVRSLSTLYAIRSTPHAIRGICRLSSAVRHLSSVFCRLSSAVCHLPSVLAPLQLSRELYKSPLFMQNKPKVKIGKMNITSYILKDYENKSNWTLGESGKNKPKQTQSQNRQNKRNFFYNNELRTKSYER